MEIITNGINMMITETIITDDPHKYGIARDRFNHQAILFRGNTMIIYIPKGHEITDEIRELLKKSKDIKKKDEIIVTK